MTVMLEEGKGGLEEAIAVLSAAPDVDTVETTLIKSIDVEAEGVMRTCALTVFSGGEHPLTIMRDRITGKAVELGESGVVLTEKLADMLGVNAGEDVLIHNGDAGRLRARVTDTCENYLQHYIYMASGEYERLYGEAPEYNTLSLTLKEGSEETLDRLSREILGVEGVASVVLRQKNMDTFTEVLGTIDAIILVLIVSAGLLSVIVLYTLISITIHERRREIATIKVLGFFNKEAAAYVFRENIVLTLLGAALGLIAGTPLSNYVMLTAEIELVMFGREIYLLSYLLALALTIGFALAVNLAMLRRIRRVDMVEALKAVE